GLNVLQVTACEHAHSRPCLLDLGRVRVAVPRLINDVAHVPSPRNSFAFGIRGSGRDRDDALELLHPSRACRLENKAQNVVTMLLAGGVSIDRHSWVVDDVNLMWNGFDDL